MAAAYVVEESAIVDAPPAAVYRVLSDDRQHHPRILPPAFTGLTVERGGVGAGTIMHVGMQVMGQTVSYRLEVTEPEPGRVLVETDARRPASKRPSPSRRSPVAAAPTSASPPPGRARAA